MTITCTCGHKVHQIEHTHSVISKDYDKYGQACLCYKTVCTACYTKGEWVSEDEGYLWLSEQEIVDLPYN